MADSRFFSVAGPFTLEQLARTAEATIQPNADPRVLYRDVAPLNTATETDVSFFEDRRYIRDFVGSKAGACLVREEMRSQAPEGMALLLTDEPYRAYARVAQMFYPRRSREPGIDPTAVVEPSVKLGSGTFISAGSVVEAGAELGAGCEIGPNAVIGSGVILGEDVIVGAGASLAYCIVGNRVIIHTGARIGQDGFGFVPGRHHHTKVPQLGRVLIGDDVEIGANTTVDRGSVGDTIIGAGTKIDNLVQIGHNVELGRGCIVVAQVGISGSTTIGDGVMIGGQAGLSGHLKVGGGARIAAQSGVMRDIEPGETVFGYPAMPSRQYMRQVALLARLARKKEK